MIVNTNITLAMHYLQRQQLDLAHQYLVRARAIAPNDAAVWSGMAYYEEKIGNIIEANQYYQHAIQLGPHIGAVHNNYGVFLCQQKKYAAAINQLMIAAHEPSYSNHTVAEKNAKICGIKAMHRISVRWGPESAFD